MMKKLILFILVIVNIQLLNANPLPVSRPKILLTEFSFDSNEKWSIEIENQMSTYYIDSIFIISSSGRVKVKNYNTGENYYRFFVIKSDDLVSELKINPLGDSVKVEYNYDNENFYGDYDDNFILNGDVAISYTEAIIFGNIENSSLPAPMVGQSVAKYLDVYGICNTPSLGNINASDGIITQTIKGNLYEGNTLYHAYEPFIYIFYGFGMTTFKPNDDGSYSTKIVSYNKVIDMINIDYENTGFLGNGYWVAEITPIQNKYAPDSTINADIHLFKRTEVGLNSVFSDKISALKIFPNPIKDLSFNYETTIPVKSTTSFIEIFDISGKKIAQYALEDEKGKIKLPKNVARGTYFANLMVNKKNYGTSKILVE